MRATLENNLAYALRQFATRRPSVQLAMVATLNIPVNGPEVYVLDPGGSTKSVRLPALVEEMSYLIANVGTTNGIEVYDSLNVLQTVLGPGEVKYFFSGKLRWVWLYGNMSGDDPTGVTEELRQVTAAGAQVVSATEPGLVINKAVASPTPITLPLASSRLGKPIRFVDWRGNVSATNNVPLTPSGADKIMNLSSYSIDGIAFGGVILFPHTGLGGYTIGG